MSILIKTVRIAGFRALENIELQLERTTVLTGMNNTGKTSFLKALQIALGNRQFISQDDFFVSDHKHSDEIIIDLKIVPVDKNGKETSFFSDDWEEVFQEKRIVSKIEASFVSIRTIVKFNELTNTYKTSQQALNDWGLFKENGKYWFENVSDAKENSNNFKEMPFFYVDAKRDILDDIKIKNSYLGKMLSKIEYNNEDVEALEKQIKDLNDKAVDKSYILKNIRDNLKGLETAMDSSDGEVEITPFTKKIRDLNKGVSIYYKDKDNSFSMEYHGMGTRSWSSLLTLKAFIALLERNSEEEKKVFFPIIALEEPESHLHPNAQKKLYNQISSMCGQTIISTHSPYIATSAELNEIRSLYKKGDRVVSGRLNLDNLSIEDIRKIKQKVVHSKGELFFSKGIVLFEGETEEQALPIFAKKYFKQSSFEMGLDFIGVGGSGNYLPFLRFADSLSIPWFILSDGEKPAINDVTRAVKKIIIDENLNINECENVFILNDGADFEKNLLNDGFIEEIKSALKNIKGEDYLDKEFNRKNGTFRKPQATKEKCSKCEQFIFKGERREYDGEEGYKSFLYDCMTSQKTAFGVNIAEVIVNSDKEIPIKIKQLFDVIKKSL
jgi:putative ATP-dependent endonuclease of OLD family